MPQSGQAWESATRPGNELPSVGQFDMKTQRVAGPVAEATQTVDGTGPNGRENNVVSAFVHFGEAQTQTRLLVRRPSLEIPTGSVKLPDNGKIALIRFAGASVSSRTFGSIRQGFVSLSRPAFDEQTDKP